MANYFHNLGPTAGNARSPFVIFWMWRAVTMCATTKAINVRIPFSVHVKQNIIYKDALIQFFGSDPDWSPVDLCQHRVQSNTCIYIAAEDMQC